jgi:hypothetical protein
MIPKIKRTVILGLLLEFPPFTLDMVAMLVFKSILSPNRFQIALSDSSISIDQPNGSAVPLLYMAHCLPPMKRDFE